MGKKPYVFQVSTKPDISAYKWVNKEWSILSTILLWFIWVCRFLSLYQHLKALYRIIVAKIGKGSTDNLSGRANIPPMMGEIYYIAWTALFVCAHIFRWTGLWLQIAVIYYLFESTVWILYYTIFRRFFELGYTIYHRLEYLTAIFLIIPTQALCFAKLYGVKFVEILTGLLGAGTDATPFPVRILGCIFSAIVISMIISSFPMEAIKKKDQRPRMFVLGCGDVVRKRLYPAIQNSGCASRVEAYDLEQASHREPWCKYLRDSGEISGDIHRKLEQKDVLWIETPSDTHVDYLQEFIDTKASLIVMEKPIAVKKAALQTVSDMLSMGDNRDRIFFLSYYILEKALPLTFLANHNPLYRKYLDVEDAFLAEHWGLMLGKLEKAEIIICEGEDTRQWAFDEEKGGQQLETFLHNVLIAGLFCGQPGHWSQVAHNEVDEEHKIYEISLSAKSGDADIALLLKKNVPAEDRSRKACFTFAAGRIEADFDRQTARIYSTALNKQASVSVKKKYAQRYSVMTDMVNRVVAGECETFEIDGLINQMESLHWLIDLWGLH